MSRGRVNYLGPSVQIEMGYSNGLLTNWERVSKIMSIDECCRLADRLQEVCPTRRFRVIDAGGRTRYETEPPTG